MELDGGDMKFLLLLMILMLLMLNIHVCGANVQHLSDGTWLSNGPFQIYQKGLGQLKNYNACQNFPNPRIKNVLTVVDSPCFHASQLTMWLLTTFLRITDVLTNLLILD